MRILIDECIDPRVKTLLAGHHARTVNEMGWSGLKDRPLLEIAQQSFDALLTIDGNIEFQQNIRKLRLGIVVISVPKNQMPHYVDLQQQILEALVRVQPAAVIHVPA